MGTWGVGPFDNDSAADWLAELEERDEAALRDALAAAADAGADAYIDIDTAAEALAAAEVVAASCGHATPSLPETALAWVGAHGVPAVELVELALRAAKRVGDASELRELWDEAANPAWLEAVRDLRFRLGDVLAT
jgi:hypothetical protein